MKKALLIAEDEEVTLALLRNVFERSDLLVHEARTGEEALQLIDQQPIDVILTDLKMPGADGLSVLAHARKVRPGAEVILMTGRASVRSARAPSPSRGASRSAGRRCGSRSASAARMGSSTRRGRRWSTRKI